MYVCIYILVIFALKKIKIKSVKISQKQAHTQSDLPGWEEWSSTMWPWAAAEHLSIQAEEGEAGRCELTTCYKDLVQLKCFFT